MNSKYKYLIKNTGILAISNFSSKLLVFFLVPLYTSALSISEYGLYDLVISTVTLLYPILTMNIVDSVMRFSMERKTDHTKLVDIALKIIVAGYVIMAFLLFGNHIFGLWKDIVGSEGYIFLYYLFYTLQQLLIQFAKGLERVKDLGIVGIIGTVVTVFFNVLLLLFFKQGLVGFFVASILGQAVPAIYLAIRIRIWDYIRFEFDKSLQREMLRYCTPLIMTTIAWWLNITSDKYVVTFFCGVAANGLLSIAYKIPMILNTLQGIFIQAWQVSAIKEQDSDEAKGFYRNIFGYLNALMCVGCAGLIVLTKPLAQILYAKDFYEAWKYVPFLLVSSVLNAASGYVGPILLAKKDSKSMAMSAVYGASANVVLNITFVYLMGIQGATIATVVSSYIIYIVRKRATGDTINSKKYKWIMMSWILLLVEAGCEVWIGSYVIEVSLSISIMAIYADYMIKMLNKICRNRSKR